MKKITLFFIITLFTYSIQGQVFLAQETFDTDLGTWTVTDGGAATGDTWVSGAQGGVNNLNGTNMAFVDSDANGNGTQLVETLTSPAFDTTTGTVILLEFEQYFRFLGPSDFGSVEVWDGTMWQVVLNNTATIGAFGAPDEQSIDVTAHSNAAMQVRFTYDDGDTWAWYWSIDNVTVIEAPTCVPAIIDSSTIVDSCNPDGTGTYTIDIVVSDAGDAGSVFDDGTTTYPVVMGTVTVGPYNSGDSVTIDFTAVDPACNDTLGTFDFTCPQPPPANDDCANAEAIVCGGQYIGDTTSATPEDPDPGTCGTTAGTAGAVWYTFTGANSNDAGAAVGTVGDEVTLDLSLSTFDTKIRVFEGSCAALVCVDGDDDGGAGTTSLLTLPTLVGTEYYVLVHGFSGNAGAYTLDVTCVPPPLCSPAVVDSSAIVDSCNPDGTGTFTVDIVVSDAGDAGSVFDDGTTTYPVVVGTVTAGPYNSGDSVTIELTAVDTACSATVGTFEFTCPQPPPVNDDIAAAIAVTVDEGFCDGTNTNGTNVDATDSAEAVGSCFNGAAADNDVWFSFTVPATTASVDVSTDFTGGTLVDSEIAVYSGTSGSLVELACSQDEGTTTLSNGFSWNSLITDLAVTAGETYYVQVAGYGTTTTGTFCLDIATNQVLSVDNFENEAAFSYYPNPVKNTLTLNAQNSIEHVAMYNMLGQEVLRATPNAVDSELDMSNLQAGAYFVKVTIANVTKTVRVIKQ